MSTVNEHAVALRGKEFCTSNFPNDRVERQLELTLSENIWNAILGKIPPEEVMKETQSQFPNAFM